MLQLNKRISYFVGNTKAQTDGLMMFVASTAEVAQKKMQLPNHRVTTRALWAVGEPE